MYILLVDVDIRGQTQLNNILFVIFTKKLNLMKHKIIDYVALSFYLKKKPTI